MTLQPLSFQLDRSQTAVSSLVYRPWSTRSLKVQVQSDTALPSLRLRPSTMRQAEIDKGIFRGYADDSDAFVISWGGGHEPGPCLKAEDFLVAFERCVPLAAGEVSTLYFNLTHRGPDLPPTAVITLEAFDAATGRVVARLPVSLQRPSPLPDDLMRLQPAGDRLWVVGGRFLSNYDPRWWPAKSLTYTETSPPPLTVVQNEASLHVCWDGTPVATIDDHTRPSALQADSIRFEMMGFNEQYLALRIWFFWLDSAVGPRFFVGRHEVPDAERFDLLIHRHDGQPFLACTDLHWREAWGEVTAVPLQATLGMNRATQIKLARDKLAALQEKEGHGTGPVYNPLDYINRLALRGPLMTLDKGTEAHIPMLHNVSQNSERMISSDVRLG